MELQNIKKILSTQFNIDKWKDLLTLMFPKVEYFTKETSANDFKIKNGGQIGNIRLDDGRSLALFCFEVADNIVIANNRKGLRDIAVRYVDQSIIHGAFVFYYSKSQRNYRLSFVAKQTYFSSEGELKTNETAPKRYTFLLGENEACTTAALRLNELIQKKKKGSVFLADVTESFSVERLNKDFFNGYKAQYKKFLDKLDVNRKDHRDYVKKLLGRIVFLHFLQKKGWLGVPAGNKNWDGGDFNYLYNLISIHKDNNRLLSDVLECLFFETLNEKREYDLAPSVLGKQIRIPYLNGGLFDKDSLDKLNIDFPYSYFLELMEFFAMYNFTIDENDPEDAEIGIDPEMLGHIFENLLEDNKDKGAFYTPKEIVQYMSQESVVQYLKTHNDVALHDALDNFVKKGIVREDLQNKVVATKIYNCLKHVKVCDPAIGSGAFPMGVLNVLFNCRELLHGFMPSKYEDLSPSQVKRDIIQENIYGVDIEQGAVDIARLRFWLSLVVYEQNPQPLPNLDYKIMCGNSIVSRYPLDMKIEDVFSEYNKLHKTEKITLHDFQQLVQDYTVTSLHEEKQAFRTKIEDIKGAFKTQLDKAQIGKRHILESKILTLESPTLFGVPTKEKLKEAKELRKKLKKMLENEEQITSNQLYKNSFEWRFEFPSLLDDKGNFTGFDIVIGNPPYGVSIKDNYRKHVEKFFGKVPDYEIYYYFIEIAGIILNQDKGIMSYIIPNTYLFNTFADKYRKAIFEKWNILEILDCTKIPIFESATVLNTINLWQKGYSEHIGYRNTSNAKSFKDLINQQQMFIDKNDLLSMNQNWGLAFFLDSDVINIVNRISQNGESLCKYFPRISQGLIAYDKYRGQSNDIIESRAFHHEEYQTGYKKWLWGEDVSRYSISWNGKEYVDYCEGIANPRNPMYFTNKRILVREITNPSVFAVITSEELYNDPSIINILDSGLYSIKVTLAILNSKLGTFYHFNHSPKATKGAFPKILVQDLKEFPLPSINNKNKESIDCLVDYIMFLKDKLSLVISTIVSNDFIADFFEKIIDGCVYEIYFEEHVKERELNILDEVAKRIKPIKHLKSEKEKGEVILDIFNEIKKTDNIIRDRLELFTVKSPEILKHIIEG